MVSVFKSLKTNLTLDSELGTSHVFIIDDEILGEEMTEKKKFAMIPDSSQISNNNMVDDVKVILAEYRTEKENNIYKGKL